MTSPAPEAAAPRDLLFTLFGEYLLERADSVWVGSLITLLSPFGLAEGTVRTTLSRMVKKGWLEGRREGRHAFYALTRKGRRLLEEGTERIFRPSRRSSWDGVWFLLAYSIPQDSRRIRDRLRDRLAWLGFGSIGNGVWISPHDVSSQVDDLARSLGLEGHFVGFSARRVTGEDNEALVRRCWDLDALAVRYRDFAERWSPVLREIDQVEPGAERSFTLRFSLIHEFRRFPLEDPYLPRPLLPDPWAGDAAAELFHSLHDRLVGPADAHVEAVLAADAEMVA